MSPGNALPHQSTRMPFSCRARHGNLLTDHRPRRHLEPVPPAKHTQCRPCGHQWRHRRIAREVRRYRLEIGIEVEHASYAFNRRSSCSSRETPNGGEKRGAHVIVRDLRVFPLDHRTVWSDGRCHTRPAQTCSDPMETVRIAATRGMW